MQQIIQPIDGRQTEVAEIPTPICGPNQVLIANRYSLISAGTERSTIELARKSLLQKARSRPDHVRRVIEKVRAEGFWTTVRQVRAKLEQPMPLGYSSAGVVIEVGEQVREFCVGDRVASNGPHAGVVAVGKNLVARVPDHVPFDHACYAVVGSIALQGIRLARVGLGDVVVVIGLGLIGQIAVSLLKSAGCRVVGTDVASEKRELARKMGADQVAGEPDLLDTVGAMTNGRGADAVLICASTSSNGPIELAAKAARQKGRIVAVGAVGMEIPRRDFYPKELEFVVSCSYGPGRYDPNYEELGQDYPPAYVRWTEQRNIEAVIAQMAEGRLDVAPLTSHRFPIEAGAEAYRMIERGEEPYVGILLEYPEKTDETRRVNLIPPRTLPAEEVPKIKYFRKAGLEQNEIGLSVIGAGNFVAGTLLPVLRQARAFSFRGLISGGGLSAAALGQSHGFHFAGSDYKECLADERTAAVAVVTRHDQHTPIAIDALRAGKHVFLEKPLVISQDQLEDWLDARADWETGNPIWTVGFNRRFAPPATMLREAFASVEGPKLVSIRFNAGAVPPDHWTQNPEIGGGRIIGEACHAVDLATFLTGSLPVRVHAAALALKGRAPALDDDVALTLYHADGSLSSIIYTASGDRAAGKERVELFGGGITGVIDDFRAVTVYRSGRRIAARKWWSQQKGYAEEIAAFARGIAAAAPPIPYAEILAVTAATLRAVESLRLELPLEIDLRLS